MLDEYESKPGFEDALFFKLDDDIVFIRDGTFEAMTKVCDMTPV